MVRSLRGLLFTISLTTVTAVLTGCGNDASTGAVVPEVSVQSSALSVDQQASFLAAFSAEANDIKVRRQAEWAKVVNEGKSRSIQAILSQAGQALHEAATAQAERRPGIPLSPTVAFQIESQKDAEMSVVEANAASDIARYNAASNELVRIEIDKRSAELRAPGLSSTIGTEIALAQFRLANL